MKERDRREQCGSRESAGVGGRVRPGECRAGGFAGVSACGIRSLLAGTFSPWIRPAAAVDVVTARSIRSAGRFAGRSMFGWFFGWVGAACLRMFLLDGHCMAGHPSPVSIL